MENRCLIARRIGSLDDAAGLRLFTPEGSSLLECISDVLGVTTR